MRARRRNYCATHELIPSEIRVGTRVAVGTFTMTTHSAIHHDPTSAALAVSQYDDQVRLAREQRHIRNARLYSLGRVLIGALFVVSAIAKVASYSATIDALRGTLAGPEILVPAGIVIELICGSFLLLGFKASAAASVLGSYLLVLTFLIHHDLSEPLNRSFALANIGLVGSLLMVVAHGAGGLSLDHLRKTGSSR